MGGGPPVRGKGRRTYAVPVAESTISGARMSARECCAVMGRSEPHHHGIAREPAL